MKEFKEFAHKLSTMNRGFCNETPSLERTQEFADTLIRIFFPIKYDCVTDEREIELELQRCSLAFKELLLSIGEILPESPEAITEKFYARLPEAFEAMMNDAVHIARFDPASRCVEEVLLAYPGFYCISVYRLAHILYTLKVPYIPRIMMEHVHGKTGIDIHPGAKIDTPFFIDHGTGVVIGETAEIGKNVKIYQGVTLGAKTVEKSLADVKRHPTIEDNVVIYAGSTILGGKTTIGHDSVLGGNTWITESILPHSMVYRQHRVVVKDHKDFKAPLDYNI